MVNLDELKVEIQTIGDTIKALKSSSCTSTVDKEAISTAVASLLTAKQLYAEHNNGIGVDGQPFVKDQSSSSSKKDKKKSSSNTDGAAETTTTAGDSKQVGWVRLHFHLCNSIGHVCHLLIVLYSLYIYM